MCNFASIEVKPAVHSPPDFSFFPVQQFLFELYSTSLSSSFFLSPARLRKSGCVTRKFCPKFVATSSLIAFTTSTNLTQEVSIPRQARKPACCRKLHRSRSTRHRLPAFISLFRDENGKVIRGRGSPSIAPSISVKFSERHYWSEFSSGNKRKRREGCHLPAQENDDWIPM